MSTKQILQNTNAVLLPSHLQTIQTLQTADDIRKQGGAYVWKKYAVIPAVTVTAPTFTLTFKSNQSNITLSNSSFDCSKVENFLEFFIDFQSQEASNVKFALYNENFLTIPYTSGSVQYANGFVSQSANSGYFTTTGTISVNETHTMKYIGTKTLSEVSIGTQLGYVVDSDPNAYPDGGEQDGYWYENVMELTPQVFGCRRMAIDNFTLADVKKVSATNINHSLGTVPKLAIIIKDSVDEGLQSVVVMLMALFTSGNQSVGVIHYQSGKTYNYANSFPASSSYVSTNTVLRFMETTYSFINGKSYTLITMV